MHSSRVQMMAGSANNNRTKLEVTYLVRREMPLSETRSTKVRSSVRRGSLMMACSPTSVTSRHTARFRLLRLLQRRSRDRPA